MESSGLKGFVCILYAFAFFQFSANAAEIYRWTDDEGVIHVTDDPSNVPANYWESERVKKEEVRPVPAETQPVQPVVKPPVAKGEKGQLYGDYPLDWWVNKFKDLRKDIADTEDRLGKIKNYVTVFEGGRRYGRVFTEEEISQYDKYKIEAPSLEEKITKLKNEMDELQRKSAIYGVPRNIRE